MIAAAGPKRRELSAAVRAGLHLPEGFREPRVCMPGILAVSAPPFAPGEGEVAEDVARFCASVGPPDALAGFPLVLLVDDSDFAARHRNNWLWVAFTRSNPAADVHGVSAFTHQKHWGCRGPVVIDARIKPHHAPPLVEDPDVSRRVDALAVRGGPLHGLV